MDPILYAIPWIDLSQVACAQFPVSEQASRELLALPLRPEMTLSQQDGVIAVLENIAG